MSTKIKMNKKIEPTGDVCIKFTDDELDQLNIKCGDKFSIETCNDDIILKKYVSLELDLSEFPRETLEFLIKESNRLDVTISEYMEDILSKYIDNIDKVES
jgi:hypothetical protein